MGMTKGKKHYPDIIKQELIKKQKSGRSVCSLSKEYGISRNSIQRWCGLIKGSSLQKTLGNKRGKPRKSPISKEREQELRIKELERENDLLRSFFQAVGRK